jgi:hypothetical protein
MFQARFHSMVTVATVAIMFVGIVWVAPYVRSLQTLGTIAAGAGAVLASAAVYRGLAAALLWLFSSSLLVRKLILGRGFLEGTWVGHYVRDGRHYFTIEFFDQTDGSTSVQGREFYEGETVASWSVDSVAIDTRRMEMVYAYSCDLVRQSGQNKGLGIFKLIRQDKKAWPRVLDGYAADLGNGTKDGNREFKIKDTPVSDEIALAEAQRIFKVT